MLEYTESAELGDHARAGDAASGGAIGTDGGVDDLHDAVAQFTKCNPRIFLAGAIAVSAVQGRGAAANFLDLASNGFQVPDGKTCEP